MLSNVNALFIAWAVSLIVVVGGVLTLDAVHTPEEPTSSAENTSNSNNQTNDAFGTTQTREVPAENPLDPLDDPLQNNGETVGLPAPGEQTGPAQRISIRRVQRVIPPVALPDLLEQSPQGPLPKVAEDGRRSFEIYAASAPETDATARIALMVTDLGLKSRITQNAVAELPSDIGLAFSPYARDLNSWGERARRDGHEVFLSIPMEPVNYPQNDPGSLTLLTSHSQRESTNILKSSLGRMTGYVGVLNHMGSRFTAASDSLRPILDEVNRRGLMFVDSRTTPYSRAATMAKAIGLPTAINNGYIDKELSPDLIDEELKKLELRAKTQGAAMGMARPYPISISAIKVWVATLEERGFVLVPVTSIADMQALPR